jgi:LmbE family N-acetylglucosaminyl deacetylase
MPAVREGRRALVEAVTRRDLLVASGIAAGAAGLAPARADPGAAPGRLKVVVAGGHPGDPEAACGGTMARLADAGHEVLALCLTRGEKGVRGKTGPEAAAVRSREAQKACALLKGGVVFLDQADAGTEVTRARYEAFARALAAQEPQAVFTHWPIDSHRDHRACSLLVYDAWLASGRKFALYYYEVSTGAETQHFRPTHYVDVTPVLGRKRAACMAHESQNPAEFYAQHEAMQRFRGLECGCRQAEAFVHHEQSPGVALPP